jgi:hypothetical protein
MCCVLAHGLVFFFLDWQEHFFFQSKARTVGYARTNVIGSRNSCVIASVRSSI